MRLTVTFTLAAISALALPAHAAAQDNACPAPAVVVQSVGGPLCVDPYWLDGTWNDHPSECSHGYYQGSCAPAPQPPADLPVDAYLFQMDDPSPEYVATVEAKMALWGSPAPVEPEPPVDAAQPTTAPVVTVWLTPAELRLADLGVCR